MFLRCVLIWTLLDRLISGHCNYLVDGFVRAVSCAVIEGASSSAIVVVVTWAGGVLDHLVAGLHIRSQVSIVEATGLLSRVDRFVRVSAGNHIRQPHIYNKN